MPRSTHLPSLVSLAQNFFASEDPTLKNFSYPGACSLRPTGTATTKAHTLRLYTCDLQIWGRWGLLFGLQGWLKACVSLHAAARASCTPEKYKIPRPPDGYIHPENLVRMHCTVFTPDSRKLDRQTEGREGGRDDDRKCQLIPPV